MFGTNPDFSPVLSDAEFERDVLKAEADLERRRARRAARRYLGNEEHPFGEEEAA